MHKWDPNIADRIRALNDVNVASSDAHDYVLCWLQQTLRAYDNPVIDAAIDLGNALGLPILVYHGLREDYPHASTRLHDFILKASSDMQRGFAERGLRCVTYVDRKGHREKGLVYRLAEHAAAVLTDDQPVFIARAQAERFAQRCDRTGTDSRSGVRRVRLWNVLVVVGVVEIAVLVEAEHVGRGLFTQPVAFAAIPVDVDSHSAVLSLGTSSSGSRSNL